MDNFTKVSTAVTSHMGVDRIINLDNFYDNGRYGHYYENGNIRVSSEKVEQDHVFAICDGMGGEGTQESDSISIINELSKYQGYISKFDIYRKINLLKEYVELTNNLLYSKALGQSEEKKNRIAFAGLIVTKGKVAMLNVGSTGIYLLRDEKLEDIVSYNRKIERLSKAGILNESNEDVKSGTDSAPEQETRMEVCVYEPMDLRQGDVFLLCSDGLTSYVSDEKIRDLLSSGDDEKSISNKLTEEALNNGSKDDITVFVVKIKGFFYSLEENYIREKSMSRYANRHREKGENVRTYVAAAITCAVISAFLLAAFYLWYNKDDISKNVYTAGQRLVQTKAPPEPTPAVTASQPSETGETDAVLENRDNATQEPQDTASEQNSIIIKDNFAKNNSESFSYEVQPGDTLQKISRKFYNNDAEKYRLIMEYNGIKDPGSIRIGQIINIPVTKDR